VGCDVQIFAPTPPQIREPQLIFMKLEISNYLSDSACPHEKLQEPRTRFQSTLLSDVRSFAIRTCSLVGSTCWLS